MAINNVTLRQLRYFVSAARNGQFSMAATSESVSQSAITNAVLALEKELGVRLFERLAQGIRAITRLVCGIAYRIQNMASVIKEILTVSGQRYALRQPLK